MTFVMIKENNKTISEVGFESFRVAERHFNKVVADLAPKAERKHFVEDHIVNARLSVYLMRGRLVEEYIEL